MDTCVCVHEDGLTCSPSCFDCCVRDEQTHGSRVRTCVVCEPTHPPLCLVYVEGGTRTHVWDACGATCVIMTLLENPFTECPSKTLSTHQSFSSVRH